MLCGKPKDRYLNIKTGQSRNRKSVAIARIYLTSLIIELSFTRRCFLSIPFDCGETSDDTFERSSTPGAIYRGGTRGNSAYLRMSFRSLTSSASSRCIQECNHECN